MIAADIHTHTHTLSGARSVMSPPAASRAKEVAVERDSWFLLNKWYELPLVMFAYGLWDTVNARTATYLITCTSQMLSYESNSVKVARQTNIANAYFPFYNNISGNYGQGNNRLPVYCAMHPHKDTSHTTSVGRYVWRWRARWHSWRYLQNAHVISNKVCQQKWVYSVNNSLSINGLHRKERV